MNILNGFIPQNDQKENISNALNNIDFDMVEDVYESTKQKKEKPTDR